MDHLPVPIHNITRPAFQVPYVCTPRFSYDDKGFLTYPYRVGVDVLQLCSSDLAWDFEAPFIQAWLWFGLLGETLGIGSRAHVPQRNASFSAFMENLPGGKTIVTTTKLRQAVVTALEKNESPLYLEFYRARFDSSLAEATAAVNLILDTPTCQRELAKAESFSDLSPVYLILFSVQLLIESLRSYRDVLFSTSTHRNYPNTPHPDHRPDLIDILLREAGWCPYEVRHFSANLQIKYFMCFTWKHGRDEHTACSPEGCCRGIVDDDAIVPHHTSLPCSCEMVCAAEATISDITNKEELPLLTFLEVFEGKRQLRFKQMQRALDDTPVPFIAISHVRRLGLGNAQQHALPYCQLSFLQVLADEVVKKSGDPAAFCIDTMCIPSERGPRKRALRNLHKMFANANAVVVLDPSLLNSKVGSELDCILRIRCSDWIKRLWTLQEGAVAKKLWFKFSNRMYELGDILEDFKRSHHLSIMSPHQEPDRIDESQLLVRLAALDDDFKYVIELIDSGALVADIYKKKLYAILRLGYLGLPRYRYFREDNERALIQKVLQTLQQVYGEERIRSSVSGMHALERLQQMCSIELKSGTTLTL